MENNREVIARMSHVSVQRTQTEYLGNSKLGGSKMISLGAQRFPRNVALISKESN